MITLGTNQRTESCAGNEYTFTAANDDKLGEALLIRSNRSVVLYFSFLIMILESIRNG